MRELVINQGLMTCCGKQRSECVCQVVNWSSVGNAFCATGTGGGINPTCSPGIEEAGKTSG